MSGVRFVSGCGQFPGMETGVSGCRTGVDWRATRYPAVDVPLLVSVSGLAEDALGLIVAAEKIRGTNRDIRSVNDARIGSLQSKRFAIFLRTYLDHCKVIENLAVWDEPLVAVMVTV